MYSIRTHTHTHSLRLADALRPAVTIPHAHIPYTRTHTYLPPTHTVLTEATADCAHYWARPHQLSPTHTHAHIPSHTRTHTYPHPRTPYSLRRQLMVFATGRSPASSHPSTHTHTYLPTHVRTHTSHPRTPYSLRLQLIVLTTGRALTSSHPPTRTPPTHTHTILTEATADSTRYGTRPRQLDLTAVLRRLVPALTLYHPDRARNPVVQDAADEIQRDSALEIAQRLGLHTYLETPPVGEAAEQDPDPSVPSRLKTQRKP